jgi:hypothetical protein
MMAEKLDAAPQYELHNCHIKPALVYEKEVTNHGYNKRLKGRAEACQCFYL